MKFRAALSIALAVPAFAGAGPAATIAAATTPAASAWQIGPIIRGRNYSVGMPLRPAARRGGGIQIDLPRAPGSAHYVTFPHGSLAGKSRIVMRYRVEAAPGVRIAPPSSPQGNGLITLYFQRAGDNWSGRRQFEAFRWYGTFATQTIRPGEHVMVAPLSGNWTAVETSSARSNPRAFADALANADQVGFVLGGGDGYGHGVFATGPARIVVTDFRIE
ncbi:MAG TPA: hypothetical protein VFO69_02840 [Allosphingosinicella sp.]|nr:hypothetical protein [Allosphingosinicella sp.]